MTTLTYPANTIMGYVPVAGSVVGVDSVCGLPQWAGSQLLLTSSGSLSTSGMRSLNIDPDGTETLQRAIGSIGVAEINNSAGGAFSLSADEASVYFMTAATNSAPLAVIRASDFGLLGTFGLANSSLGPSDNTRILSMDKMVFCGTQQLAAPQFQGELDLLPGDLSGNLNLGNMTENFTDGVVVGPASGNLAYSIGMNFRNGGGSGDHTSPVGLYKVNGVGSFSKIGTVSPAQIDATWTHILFVGGIAYDNTDGNVIIGVTTNDAVGTQDYILKLSTVNAAILWKRAVNNVSPFPNSFTWGRIANGTLHLFGSGASPTAYHIKTSDGSVTTETVHGVSANGIQFSDDVTNSIIFFGSFSEGVSPPNYVGALMGTGGNHNVSNIWMRFWFATAGPPPPVGSGRRHIGELGPVFVTS